VGRVEKIEHEVATLSSDELASFRAWYAVFDSEAWDRQIEQDAVSGRLDALASQALEAHSTGKTKAL
jgi:hypothetical protein